MLAFALPHEQSLEALDLCCVANPCSAAGMNSATERASLDRIFLIGPMGSGKTTIGRQLSRRLGMDFLDLDLELQDRCGVEVAIIFDIEGESGFRQRESALLDELTRRDGLILATGGGSVLQEANRRMLTERGLVVYLQTSVDQQLKRLERDKQRPLLQAPDRRRRLRELAEQRNPIYEACADLAIRSSNISPAAMAAVVTRQIRDYRRQAQAS